MGGLMWTKVVLSYSGSVVRSCSSGCHTSDALNNFMFSGFHGTTQISIFVILTVSAGELGSWGAGFNDLMIISLCKHSMLRVHAGGSSKNSGLATITSTCARTRRGIPLPALPILLECG